MASDWRNRLAKCKRDPHILMIVLALLRILICFFPESGYFHEDEFFPALELSAHRSFKSKVEFSYESGPTKPTRSMLIPSFLHGIAFKFLTPKSSAKLLLIAPRLVYSSSSFLIDFSLYKLCQYYSSRGLWYLPISVVFQTSYITLILFTRTLSSVPEAVIFSLLLATVCRVLKPRFRIVFVTPNRKRPASERVKVSTQLTSSILVGILFTLGMFNRPTFVAYAVAPLTYWTMESFKRNSINPMLTFHRAIVPAALAACVTAIFVSGFDTIYYRDIKTLMDILEHLFKFRFNRFKETLSADWVFTPYNQIRYYSGRENLSADDIYLPYYHMMVNLPVAFGLLAVLFYRKLGQFASKAGVRRLTFSSHRIYSMMFITTITSVSLLSFVPNQEMRLISPLIVPLVYIFGFKIYSSTKLLSSWLLLNLLFVLFHTQIYETGTIRSVYQLDPIIRSHASVATQVNTTNIHLIQIRSPHIPTFLWNVPASDTRFHFDLQDNCSSASGEDASKCLTSKLNKALSHAEQETDSDHIIFVLMPSFYSKFLRDYHKSHLVNQTELSLVRTYEPHLSSRAIRESLNLIDRSGPSRWRTAFGFAIFRMHLGGLIDEEVANQSTTAKPTQREQTEKSDTT